MKNIAKAFLIILLALPFTKTTAQQVMVDCGMEAGVNEVFCYENNETLERVFTASSIGNVLNLKVNSGKVDNPSDEFIVLDTDGTELYNGYGDMGGQLTGYTFQSTGNSITVQVQANQTFSCSSSGYEPIDITVTCATCINPSVDYVVMDECDSGMNEFSIDVNITDMGTATTLLISDNQASTSQEAIVVGTYTFGPYAIGTEVAFTIENQDNGDCVINSNDNGNGWLSLYEHCPPENDDCAGAIQVPVNENLECNESVTGVLKGATASDFVNTCNGDAENDVWFKFTAVSDTHTIAVLRAQNYQESSPEAHIIHAVYEGSSCNDLTLMYCKDEDFLLSTTSVSDQYTIGETYWLRIFSEELSGYETASFSLCILASGLPLTTSDAYTVEELVNDVLIDNPCAEISNITYSTGTNFGENNGIGYFDNNEGLFPIGSGVIMSTGDISEAGGPEKGVGPSFEGSTPYIQKNGSNAWPGDDDLTNLIHEIEGNNEYNSVNASIIEFDIVPYANEMSFDFIFASEEYGGNECEYSDLFAFFLTDEDGNTSNLAVLPGTDTPIAVTTVRTGEYTTLCGDVNEEYFGAYYNPEEYSIYADPGEYTSAAEVAPINFIGSTVTLTAFSEVTPGKQYHVKLAIADRRSSSWDSAVFIQKGSFDINVNLGSDLTIEEETAVCSGEQVVLNSGLPNDPNINFIWFKGGNEDSNVLQGEEGPTLTVNEADHYYFTAYTNLGCILYEDDVMVEFYPVPEVELGNDFSICPTADNILLVATPANANEFDELHYSWEDENGNVISTEENYNVTDEGTYTVTVSGHFKDDQGNIISTCDATDTLTVTSQIDFSIDIGGDQSLCGTNTYTLTANITGTASGDLTFEWSDDNGVIAGETSQNLTVNQSGTYTLIASKNGCSSSPVSAMITLLPIPDVNLGGTEIITCNLDNILLDATPSNITDLQNIHFTWTYNGTVIKNGEGIANATVNVNAASYSYGTYKVKVFHPVDPTCETSQEITVIKDIPSVTLKSNGNDHLYCVGETVILTPVFSDNVITDEAIYTWYRDDGVTLDDKFDSNLSFVITSEMSTSTYSVSVSLANGCTVTGNIEIGTYEEGCEIPRGISPGADGINDCLDLSFLHERTGIKSFKLYSRYGRLVYEKENYIKSWCGKDKNGNILPVGTYYYVIELKSNDDIFGFYKRGWIYINTSVQ